MKQLLIFGGNGFIGFEFLLKILENSVSESDVHKLQQADSQPQCHLTLVNRGKSWDWDKLSLLSKYGDIVTRIKWDRKQPLRNCDQLVTQIDKIQCFDAVVDFSAYSKSTLKESLSLVRGKCSLYVYVSSDSVYEVCKKSHSGPTRETDAVRPVGESERARLKRLDKYGHRKLKCEELLARQEDRPSSVPYVIFRLPDAFGARDSTHRLWQYLVWMKLCERYDVPLYVPARLAHKSMSLAYVCDVAAFLVKIIFCDSGSEFYQRLKNQRFNLASSEQITIGNLLKFLSEKLCLTPIRVEFSSNRNVPLIYPSVNLGPIDSSKAESMLSWKPSMLQDALSNTVGFYDSVMNSEVFPAEKTDCIDEVLDNLDRIYDVRPLSDRSQCAKALKEILHVE